MTAPISVDIEAQEKVRRHTHEFTALWWHFGPYGRQDVHVHGCFTEGCDRVLIGEQRECSGSMSDHHRETLR